MRKEFLLLLLIEMQKEQLKNLIKNNIKYSDTILIYMPEHTHIYIHQRNLSVFLTNLADDQLEKVLKICKPEYFYS